MMHRVEVELGGRPFALETGALAKQADGAVLVQYGGTVVLVTVVTSADLREGIDFLPLTVDYQEKMFAAGKVPGGFFKREGRPTEKEILTSRFIDRPIRPLFPPGFRQETQVIATVFSVDRQNDADVLAMTAASAALTVSDIPFDGPVAGVRVGKVDGKFVINPTYADLERSTLDVIVAGRRDAVVMVEGGAKQVTEAEMCDAIAFGHREMQLLLELQEKLRVAAGKPKRAHVAPPTDGALVSRVEGLVAGKIAEAIRIADKAARREALAAARREVEETLAPEFPGRDVALRAAWTEVEKNVMRDQIVTTGARIGGRGLSEIRPLSMEVGKLPRTHGSALFTRGETQVMVVTTLGTSEDEQKIDALIGEYYKSFMLHYNFPPYCVGEVRMLRGPARRDIGHGALAERALQPVLPPEDQFPYTIRIVSEVLESNGSSSMATVCGGSLSLMDAGVPIAAPVAGIAMGLVQGDDGRVAILTDILGDEDHLGDMDFKVAGTPHGITALQMDIKTRGLTLSLLRDALEQARTARLHILERMRDVIASPRPALSAYAPRIVAIQINPERIRDVIGPGGKMIRSIIERTGVKIDVEDSGKVNIASSDGEATEAAIRIIRELTREAELGRVYMGKVKRLMEFGAFVEIMPGTDGLVHISHLAEGRIRKVEDVVKEGDVIPVKVIDIDRSGKIRLSRKEALKAASS